MNRAVFETKLGWCGIAWTEQAIMRLQLPEKDRAATLKRLGGDSSPASPPRWVKSVMRRVEKHVAGKPQNLDDVPLALETVTPFYARVYRAARDVGAGQTKSYGEIAKAIDSPKSARAVGQALGKNPFALIVPCHRILAQNGKPGGFSAAGGLDTKARLLASEGVVLRPARPLFTQPAHPERSAAKSKGERAPSSTLRQAQGERLSFSPKHALTHLSKNDPVLARLISKVGPFRMQLASMQSVFESLAESIVYQQLHGKAAATIFSRVQLLFPSQKLDPKRLLSLPEAKLRGAGLSQNKMLALKDLAAKTLDGKVPTLDEMHALDSETIIERLTEVRGIGRWTVEMLLMFRLGRPDILPVADYGVRKGFAIAFGKRELPTPKALAAHGECWHPYRTVASWYLWRATEN